MATTMTYSTPKKSSFMSALTMLTFYRYRWQLAWMIGYLFLASAGVHIYHLHGDIVYASQLPLFVIAISLVVFFANSENNLASHVSSYPRDLLIRPINTYVLTLAPMLACNLTFVVYWIAFNYLVLMPGGYPFTLQPLLLGIIYGNWTLAYSWIPMARSMRVFAGIVFIILSISVMMPMVMYRNNLSFPVFGTASFIIAAATYVTSISGVSLYRRGELLTMPVVFRHPGILKLQASVNQFGDWKKAMHWRIWNEDILPEITQSTIMLILGLCGIFTVFFLLRYINIPVRIPIWPSATHGWLAIQYDITSGILGSMCLTAVFGTLNRWAGSDKYMRSSIASLPVTSRQLMLIRIKGETIRLVLPFLSFFIIIALALAIPGEYHEIHKPLGQLLWILLPVSYIMLAALLFVLFFISMWIFHVVIKLSSFKQERELKSIKNIVIWTVGIFVLYVIVLFLEIIISSQTLRQTRIHHGILITMLRGFPWIVGATVLTKFALMIWSVYLSVRERILPVRVQAIAAVIWLAAYLGITITIAHLFPQISPFMIAIIVYLFLPIVRLFTAPIIFVWSRNQ